MNALLNSCLYYNNKEDFEKLCDDVIHLNNFCNGNNIVQDDIFNVIQNYSRKKDQRLEILRYPINDEDFCACTFIKEDILFVFINSKLPLSKQIFATAHELFHIYCYLEGEDPDYCTTGSILKSDSIDKDVILEEDRKANAFAGLFLAPKSFLDEQMDMYGIDKNNIQLNDIIKLMDIFAIPYKAMVLRLYEENIINEQNADELLSVDTTEINKLIQMTGTSKRWQISTENIIELGTLEEKIYKNSELGFLTEERFDSDNKTIEEIKKTFSTVDKNGF